jgi:hypothetical protein
MGEGRCEYRVLVRRPVRMITLGRLRRRWEENKMMICRMWNGRHGLD